MEIEFNSLWKLNSIVYGNHQRERPIIFPGKLVGRICGQIKLKKLYFRSCHIVISNIIYYYILFIV